ncbi:hypothetical protein NP493_66g04013 [Ridgeia piscesae]|uniref:PH domain-containing protein n=1 Tax=Ridgeia piscesae TaxID=27915 RepID=A0AAD9UIV3_RIDPI|nr:hypothetical protein NP493_66g04013 [Ridgeia piscesae]
MPYLSTTTSVRCKDISFDWSDHALWWPAEGIWLLRTRSTLDQYGVQADTKLEFTPMHKLLRVQLPDLQVLDLRINFSANVFRVVNKLCKELGIRHPEELSLARKLDWESLKKNKGISATRKHRPAGLNQSNGSLDHSHTYSPNRTPTSPCTPQGTLLRTPGSPYSFGTLGTLSSHSPNLQNGTLSPGSMQSLSFEGAADTTLANSPHISVREALLMLYRPKNYQEKARINAGWLDSSQSLLEQGVEENSLVLLRFKFYNFYDLSPKYDYIRINQLYEQAKWSLLAEELDCTEEEMMMFAALQLQVQQQMAVPQTDSSNNQGEDDVDAALNDLQVSLEGSSLSSPGDIMNIPELQDYLRFYKPKKFTIKSYKKYHFTFKDTILTMCRSADSKEAPLMTVNLRGCEVTPEVNISAQKYIIKVFIPTQDSLSEVWIKTDSEDQYAKWMAACRLASKGKTMADSSYDMEVKSILAFLHMQRPAPADQVDGSSLDIQPEEFVAPRFVKKLKTKQISHRILDAHSNLKDMGLVEAKMNYIKAWQALPDYGITYFLVKMKGSKKEELLGISSNRMLLMDVHSGDTLKTWRFQNMQSWSVNWEIKQVQVCFEDKVAFHCLTADCKVVHEFIGGYIFLSMRAGDKSQTLNEEMFHKLTGGWI